MIGEPLMTVEQVAEQFGLPESWVYANAKAGKLPSYKVGHYRRFRASEIEAYLGACRQGNGNGQ